MKNNRQSRLVAILALCVSVIGLTLGFAAFSNTLTISSSATVSPDPSDFKIRAYGRQSVNDQTFYAGSYVVEKSSVAEYMINNPLSMSDAVISDDGLKISNISATFQNEKSAVYYWFGIKNEGEYDAYLDLKKHYNVLNNIEELGITCTAKTGTSQDLVDQTCANIEYTVKFFKSSNSPVRDKYYKLSPGECVFLYVEVYYNVDSSSVFADGDFDVELEDITFDFSTVPPSE